MADQKLPLIDSLILINPREASNLIENNNYTKKVKQRIYNFYTPNRTALQPLYVYNSSKAQYELDKNEIIQPTTNGICRKIKTINIHCFEVKEKEISDDFSPIPTPSHHAILDNHMLEFYQNIAPAILQTNDIYFHRKLEAIMVSQNN